eukprot:scaffold259238_cov23-Prasinocladus_malaysianus.AAC.1
MGLVEPGGFRPPPTPPVHRKLMCGCQGQLLDSGANCSWRHTYTFYSEMIISKMNTSDWASGRATYTFISSYAE